MKNAFMKPYLLSALVFLLFSCQFDRQTKLDDIYLFDLAGRQQNARAMAGSGIAVFVFMSPDCPLCINYTKTIRDLKLQFESRGVVFIPVYAGRYYTRKEILNFQREYNFELPGLLDPEFRLTGLLKATVTPEAIVISREGKKVYSGAIDNWMYETGKKSPVITQKYLETALNQVLNGKIPDPVKTEAIGCFIEL